MDKRVKRIGALAVFGIMVLIMCAPTPSAFPYGSSHNDGNSYTINIDYDNDSDDNMFSVWHDRGLKDNPPGEELFRIQEDGKVGIGEPNPTNKLDVNGSVRVRDLPQDDTLNNFVVADTNGVLHIRDISTIGGKTAHNWYDLTTDSPSTDINSDIYTNGEVGIGTDNPVTTLDVNGGFATSIHTVIDDYTATGSDYTILADASTKDVIIKLTSANEVSGQILNIKRIDDNNKNSVIIDGEGQETIDGELTVQLNTKYMSYTIQSDGSNWYIIATYGIMGNSHIGNKNR